MMLSVRERADAVATFRFIEIRLMETVARWTPTTPELEAKVMFGRHIWDFAQHADLWGKRVFELRRPLNHLRPPTSEYETFLQDVASEVSTVLRITAFYRGLLSDFDLHLENYARKTDSILDAPTLVIVERVRTDFLRQCKEAFELLQILNARAEASVLVGRRTAGPPYVLEQTGGG